MKVINIRNIRVIGTHRLVYIKKAYLPNNVKSSNIIDKFYKCIECGKTIRLTFIRKCGVIRFDYVMMNFNKSWIGVRNCSIIRMETACE